MKALTEDEVVVIYPEGTVTKRPDHLPDGGQDRGRPAVVGDRRSHHPDGVVGIAGGLAEVGQGQPEVRPPGLGEGRAADRSVRAARATPTIATPSGR